MRTHVVRALEAVGDKYRHTCDGLDVATHSVAISQFLDAQMSLKARLALDHDFEGAGDKDQVIHSTLGADAQYLGARIAHHFPAVTKLPLTVTYRQGSHLAAAMGRFKNKSYESGVARTTKIAALTYGDRQRCAELVAKAVCDWKDETGTTADCAILLRDKHQSIEIENALIEAGIAYRCDGMADYLHREEILLSS